MGQDYDFFGTGQPAAEPPPVPTTPLPRRQQFTDPSGRAVNQFGTPVEVDAAPAGPSAAPGYGAQTYRGHGLTEPVPAPAHAHAAPPLPPGAYVRDTTRRPGTVLAAGVISIVQGALLLVVSLLGLLALAALQSQIVDVTGDAALVADVSGMVRLILVLLLLVAAVYLTAGIATAAGKRWGAWTLLVVEGVGLLLGLLALVSGDSQTGGVVSRLLDLAIPVAVLVLLLLPGSRAWLQRR